MFIYLFSACTDELLWLMTFIHNVHTQPVPSPYPIQASMAYPCGLLTDCYGNLLLYSSPISAITVHSQISELIFISKWSFSKVGLVHFLAVVYASCYRAWALWVTFKQNKCFQNREFSQNLPLRQCQLQCNQSCQ